MYIDVIIGLTIVLFIMRGYKLGFFVSLLSFFGVVINLICSKILATKVVNSGTLAFLPNLDDERVTNIIYYFIAFVVIYIVIEIFLGIIKKFLRKVLKSSLDSVLGGLLGLLKGMLFSAILLLLYNIVASYNVEVKRYSDDSYINRNFVLLLPEVTSLLPNSVKREIETRKNLELINRQIKLIEEGN